MDDQDLESNLTIKIEVKEEYEENSLDGGCSLDTSIIPYSYDEDIDIKDEPCDFDEDWKSSIKLEIKEEFPCNFSGKNDFLSLSASQVPHRIKHPEVKKIKVKSFANHVASNKLEFHRLRMKFLQEEHELKTKILEAKQTYYLALREKQFDCTSLEKKFLCFHCQEEFSALQSLRLHIKYHLNSSKLNPLEKNKVKKKIIERKCQYCDRRYKRLGMLKNHINIHHKARAWMCKLCTYETNTPGNLRKHVRAYHADTYSHHYCNLCKFESAIPRELMAHVLKHEDVKLHQCLLCNFRAPKLSDIKKHEMEDHIGKDRYLCQSCDFEGKTSKLLKIHTISEHQNEKEHICQFCPFTTSRPGDLKRHMMSLHLDLKPYHCKMCDYKAVKAGDLNRHILARHSDKKPYKCDSCDYKTKRAEHLRSHLLSHHRSSSKHHFCELCSYKTLYRSSLLRHIRIKHNQNVETFRCSLCDFWSLKLDVIKKHIHEDHF